MVSLLDAVQKNRELHPHQVAFFDLDQDKSWDWESTYLLSQSIYQKIKQQNRDSKIVIVCLKQNILLPATLFACWQLNLCPLLINEEYTEQEMIWILHSTGEKTPLLISDESYDRDLNQKFANLSLNFLFLNQNLTLTSEPEENSAPLTAPALALVTSGTSSRPKIIVFSHQNLLAAAEIEAQNEPIIRGSKIWNLRPHFTSGGLNTLWPSLLLGATHFFSEKLRKTPHSRYLHLLIQKAQPDLLVMSPSYIKATIETWGEFNKLEKELPLYFGGMSLSKKIINSLIEKNILPSMRYGMTEVGHIISKRALYEEEPNITANSVGTGYSNIEIKIIDKHLAIKSPGVAQYYLKDGKLLPLFDQDWFITDDRAELTADKEILLIGREHEIICVDGFRFHSSQVEELVNEFPAELEFKLLACENTHGDIHAVAFCINKNQNIKNFDLEDQLRKFLSEKVQAFKRPKAYIWLKEWPYMANGKLNQTALKQAYKDKLNSI